MSSWIKRIFEASVILGAVFVAVALYSVNFGVGWFVKFAIYGLLAIVFLIAGIVGLIVTSKKTNKK